MRGPSRAEVVFNDVQVAGRGGSRGRHERSSSRLLRIKVPFLHRASKHDCRDRAEGGGGGQARAFSRGAIWAASSTRRQTDNKGEGGGGEVKFGCESVVGARYAFYGSVGADQPASPFPHPRRAPDSRASHARAWRSPGMIASAALQL